MTSERTTHTYLLAVPNLEDEIHLKGVSLVTSQIFDLVLHIIHCIASYLTMHYRRVERIDETLFAKTYFCFDPSFPAGSLRGTCDNHPCRFEFSHKLRLKVVPLDDTNP